MSGKAYKVFIVDDDPSSRLVSSFCFQQPEFELVQLESGEACLAALGQMPDIVLLDAVKLDGIPMKQVNIVKGDTVSVSIAAASIVAKVTRDRMIEEMDEKYPQYGFSKHKGYATKEHIEAIKKYGLCPIHRMSFTRNFTG